MSCVLGVWIPLDDPAHQRLRRTIRVSLEPREDVWPDQRERVISRSPMPRFRRPFSVRRPHLAGFPHVRKLRKELPQITLDRCIARLPLTQGGECRLASAYSVQEPDRVERSALGSQRILELGRHGGVGQKAITRRRRGVMSAAA